MFPRTITAWRMGIHSAAAALHISSSFDQRHAELAPPRSAYPPSLPPPFLCRRPERASPNPRFSSPQIMARRRPNSETERRPSYSYSPSLLPSCLFLLHPNFPSRRFPLSFPPFSSSSCAVQQQQASISSAQLAGRARSKPNCAFYHP